MADGTTDGALRGKQGQALGKYFSASQLRLDTWHRLKHVSGKLVEGNPDAAERQRLVASITQKLETLEPIETYWGFPGRERFRRLSRLLARQDFDGFGHEAAEIVRALVSRSYRRAPDDDRRAESDSRERSREKEDRHSERDERRPYFEVMLVDQLSEDERHWLRDGLRAQQQEDDPYRYEIVVVPSLEDALIGAALNPQIQTTIIGPNFSTRSDNSLDILRRVLARLETVEVEDTLPSERATHLAELLADQRPEMDVFLVSDASVEDIAGNCPANVRRVFYQLEDTLELHLNIMRGVTERYETPFFTALKDYSKRPTGVFHAMPISRGKSILKSNWIQDMGKFYGMNIFLAETSATSGGLDSLLAPSGPLKKAQELAARAFHARYTYFATNGTSTCNKIVVQALVQPGDIVLVDRDCHKSHHYGLVLSGAEVVYLDSYPLQEYSMYGAVPLSEIRAKLLALKAAGKLERVKMLLLTNCTFDGFVYNVERVMEACLAIKPDLVFLWDEAWFAFAGFGTIYRQRTAMWTAGKLRKRYKSTEYRAAYDAHLLECRKHKTDPILPDPDQVRVRAYATQSTHKTLTALRQGSMIHVHDQDFKSKVEDAFHEAYMTHTSTSPNYQILASLDIGRRQVELEGFEFVQKQFELAMVLRERINDHPLLAKWFKMLTVEDLIPEAYRESGITAYYKPDEGFADFGDAWADDEFVLDPTRLTVFVGATGADGDTFKNKFLMDRHGIQINKTSRNTVLFMTNIGTTRSSVAYLIEVLVEIARELEENLENMSGAERRVFEKKTKSLTHDLPPLPHFSRFHDAFRREASGDTPEGDIRSAYFLAYDDENCAYLSLDDGEMDEAMATGDDVVSAMFIIPYPPGFPILVPGQVISPEILEFMRKLDVKEIHGYRPDLGLRVFTRDTLKRVAED